MQLQTFEQVRAVFENRGVQLAYVFGSAARSTEGPLSDIDIAVLFSYAIPLTQQLDAEYAVTCELEQRLKGKRIDMVNLGRTHSPALKRRAVFCGFPIFIKDIKVRARFEKRVLEEYEDTKYLRRRMHASLNHASKNGIFGKALLSSHDRQIIHNHVSR